MAPASSTFTRWLALLVLLNLAARLPLCWEPAAVRNDGAEYLAIARSLRTTGQYATDLKYQFFTDDPVHHVAWGDRPPLYPAFAALCTLAMPGLDPTTAARLGNVLAAAAALVLAALYLRRLYGDTVALLAAGYVFLLPHTVYWTAQPMTESLSLLLTFGGLLVWLSSTQHPTSSHSSNRWIGPNTQHSTPNAQHLSAQCFLAGLVTGLCYLVRPTGALLALALGLDAVRGPVKGRLATLTTLAAGFLLCAAPYHLLLWRVYGSPLYSSLAYTFAVANYYAVTYYGFERPHPTTLEFLRQHAGELPRLILLQAWNHAQSLFLPLAALWPFVLRVRRADWTGDRWPAAVLVLASIVVHTLVWSAWGSSRYFLIPLVFLTAALLELGFGVQGSGLSGWRSAAMGQPSTERGSPSPSTMERGAGGEATPNTQHPTSTLLRFALLASAIGLLVSLGQLYLREARRDRGLPLLPEWKAAAVVVQDAALIASDRPATLNLLTGRPAVMLPRMTDPAQMERFIRKYRPDVMVLFIDEPEKASTEAMATAWRSGALPPGWHLVQDNGRRLIARERRESALR